LPTAAPVTEPVRPTRARSADQGTLDFLDVRSRLLGTAYRILGNWSEAEDVVQDAWFRWQSYDRTIVVNPTAFLVTTTTRLAINTATSARVRRESYVGPSLPEQATTDDPAVVAEDAQALEAGIRLLLERLTPIERAAYMLRHGFDYSYPRLAARLQISEPNARQIVSRAGRHLGTSRTRPVGHRVQRQLVRAFIDAAQRGHMVPLEDLLARDVVKPQRPINPRCAA
jgi:RNA polymerase sigma-70 factor, ECF subfamily